MFTCFQDLDDFEHGHTTRNPKTDLKNLNMKPNRIVIKSKRILMNFPIRITRTVQYIRKPEIKFDIQKYYSYNFIPKKYQITKIFKINWISEIFNLYLLKLYYNIYQKF